MAATAALEVASAGSPAFATMRALAQSQTLARTSRRGPWCSARRVFAFSRTVGIVVLPQREGRKLTYFFAALPGWYRARISAPSRLPRYEQVAAAAMGIQKCMSWYCSVVTA